MYARCFKHLFYKLKERNLRLQLTHLKFNIQYNGTISLIISLLYATGGGGIVRYITVLRLPRVFRSTPRGLWPLCKRAPGGPTRDE